MDALEVLWAVVWTIAVAGFVREVVTGRVALRDGRGRPRPLPAAVASVLVLVLIGMIGTAVG